MRSHISTCDRERKEEGGGWEGGEGRSGERGMEGVDRGEMEGEEGREREGGRRETEAREVVLPRK